MKLGDGWVWLEAMSYYILFDNSLESKVSSNETRPKTKFYNLLIYAGYPNKK